MVEGSFLVAAFLIAVFWCFQLTFLMLMEPDLFPGPHDKALWVAVFIFVAPLAPFAFHFWRQAILAPTKKKKAEKGPKS